MSFIADQKFNVDPFGSQLVVSPIGAINFKPTWGISELRYNTTATGTGAAATEVGGEFKLSSGTDASGSTTVETLERGQYQAGSQSRFGIGARLPTAPAGTANAMWGYLDANNGLAYGVDSTGVFVMRRSAGVDTKVYQTSWNIDVLDGTGPSGLTLDLSAGLICQCDFTWYGFGSIDFCFILYDSSTKVYSRVIAHSIKVDGSVSVVDPNQPLQFSVQNGGSSTANLDLFIGGHQFEHFSGEDKSQRRQTSELITNFSTALDTNWQPLISIRPKATHGTSGRANSVIAKVTGYAVAADAQMETRITVGGVTSNLAWGPPTGWTTAESAIETKVSGGTALTTSSAGFPSGYNFVASNIRSSSIIESRAQLPLGSFKEVILWVRRLSSVGSATVLHANISVEEQW